MPTQRRQAFRFRRVFHENLPSRVRCSNGCSRERRRSLAGARRAADPRRAPTGQTLSDASGSPGALRRSCQPRPESQEHFLRIGLAREAREKVIRIAHKHDATARAATASSMDPEIEHEVQEHVEGVGLMPAPPSLACRRSQGPRPPPNELQNAKTNFLLKCVTITMLQPAEDRGGEVPNACQGQRCGGTRTNHQAKPCFSPPICPLGYTMSELLQSVQEPAGSRDVVWLVT